MDITEIVPIEFIPVLTWLGKYDWLKYRMVPTGERTEIESKIFSPTPDPEDLRAALVSMIEIMSQGGDVGPITFYCLSKALAHGPKLLRATSEQCRALEHVDVNVSFSDYQQPYPAVFIELPADYQKDLSNRFSFEAPKYILSYHDSRTGFVIAMSCGRRPLEMVVNLLPPRPIYTSIEQALRKHADHGTDIDIAEVVQRIALNSCLMLIYLGVKQHGLANSAKVKKLRKAARNKRAAKSEWAKNMLAVMPRLIGFQQEIKFFTEIDDHGGGTERSPRADELLSRKPHWRRGHFRRQRVGVGRTESKLIFIRPVMVNRRFFAGEDKDTQVVYIAKDQPNKPADSAPQ